MVWKSFLCFLPLRSQSLAGSSGKPDAIDLAFALRLRLELGTRLFHGMEKSFPRCGKFWRRGGGGWVFSTVWKKVFHGVENVGGGFCGDGECGGGG